MTLTPEQEARVHKQVANHQHDRYEINIELDEGATLEGFVVHQGVLRPEVMTAVQFARYLYRNSEHYASKVAIDMGSGSGIQGITMGLNGAKKVILTDKMDEAYQNSRENIQKFDLTEKCEARKGDLFENIPELADVITFNHPFFHGESFSEHPVSQTMLNPGEVLHRFLVEAKNHLLPKGYILHPFFHFAGEGNNPEVQGPKHNYEVIERERRIVGTGLQQGLFSMHELKSKR